MRNSVTAACLLPPLPASPAHPQRAAGREAAAQSPLESSSWVSVLPSTVPSPALRAPSPDGACRRESKLGLLSLSLQQPVPMPPWAREARPLPTGRRDRAPAELLHGPPHSASPPASPLGEAGAITHRDLVLLTYHCPSAAPGAHSPKLLSEGRRRPGGEAGRRGKRRGTGFCRRVSSHGVSPHLSCYPTHEPKIMQNSWFKPNYSCSTISPLLPKCHLLHTMMRAKLLDPGTQVRSPK